MSTGLEYGGIGFWFNLVSTKKNIIKYNNSI